MTNDRTEIEVKRQQPSGENGGIGTDACEAAWCPQVRRGAEAASSGVPALLLVRRHAAEAGFLQSKGGQAGKGGRLW